jgi:hypothetical protein
MEKSGVPKKLGGDLELKCVVQLAASERHVLALTTMVGEIMIRNSSL